eukprot:TRINITY_DN3344_c0_g2_i1.p1 TRINITY_DN3344_c0_g2~~TRINITY_DN3344_c0_g2_i1.p1  ORF type:complete len:505 (+),score=156.68 TRINITY_DN3344_c0_g2_i1:331-1845(+)
MGQCTIKFNTELLSNSKLDDWFPLKKRKSKESAGGEVHLQIQYGDLHHASLTKERSSTIAETSTVDLKVSPNFNTEETNIKLLHSTHVIVEEMEEEDDGEKEEDQADKTRDGPATACLEKATKDEKDIAFTNKNLEVTNGSNNYNTFAWAKGNVKVSAGKWYFEVRIVTTGQIQVGWCTHSYNPKTNTGDAWTVDGYKQHKIRNNGAGNPYGEIWNNGDIIGCSLDIEGKTIQFSKNGKDMGVAFADVNTGGAKLTPIVGVTKRVRCLFNFGKDPFGFPQDSFHMLHSHLTEKELEQLAKLYTKYKDISNADKVKEGKAEEEGEEMKDSIHGEGMQAFAKDLGVEEEDDPTILILAWKLRTETLWEISRDEFLLGFTVNGCATIDKIKAKAKEWHEDIRKKEMDFKHFYNFVFDYLKEDKKILAIDESLVAWNIVLKDRKWPLWADFEEFLKDQDKKSISRDAWQQLWHFMKTYPKDLKEYDPMSSWPIIYDEFVDWMEAKGRK